MPGTQVYQVGGQGQATLFPFPIKSSRAPATSDVTSPDGYPYNFGQLWEYINSSTAVVTTYIYYGGGNWVILDSSAGNLETLTGTSGGPITPTGGNITITGSNTTTVVGNPSTSTLTITPTSGGYSTTPFVVGTTGQAGYQTIQSAINAAHAAGAAGGGFIFVQNGAYTENLTLFPNISISGPQVLSGFPGDEAGCYIIGTHTPPSTGAGTITFNNIQFVSTGDTFFSTAAGNTELNFSNCGSNVTNGYFLNVANWTGILSLWDNNPGSGTNDGGINNPTGGAPIFCFEAGLGAGSTHTMQTSGVLLFNQGEINCPVQFNTGTNFTMVNNEFFNTLTLAGNATGFSAFGYHSTGSNPGITMSSSAACEISNSVIKSSNNPAISGSGAGTLTLGGTTLLGNSAIANTLTVAYKPSITSGRTIVTGTSASMVTNYLYVASNAALVTLTLPSTANVGDIIEVVGQGAGGWSIAQNASQQILMNSSATTVGTGGSLSSTNKTNCVKLIATTGGTSTIWTVKDFSGTFTFV